MRGYLVSDFPYVNIFHASKFQGEYMTEDQECENIGGNLARARKLSGLTQHNLADALSITPARVGIIEHQSRYRIDTISKYIQAFGGKMKLTCITDNFEIDLLTGEIKALDETVKSGITIRIGG